jgi:integrase
MGYTLTANDFVFCHDDGTPLLPNSVSQAWIKLRRKVGLPSIRFHDARHTHASIMLKAGIHPKIVQERLGHSSIQITMDIYSHVIPGIQKAAAEKFDQSVDLRSGKSLASNI